MRSETDPRERARFTDPAPGSAPRRGSVAHRRTGFAWPSTAPHRPMGTRLRDPPASSPARPRSPPVTLVTRPSGPPAVVAARSRAPLDGRGGRATGRGVRATDRRGRATNRTSGRGTDPAGGRGTGPAGGPGTGRAGPGAGRAWWPAAGVGRPGGPRSRPWPWPWRPWKSRIRWHARRMSRPPWLSPSRSCAPGSRSRGSRRSAASAGRDDRSSRRPPQNANRHRRSRSRRVRGADCPNCTRSNIDLQ
jgi:hypothetical protein